MPSWIVRCHPCSVDHFDHSCSLSFPFILIVDDFICFERVRLDFRSPSTFECQWNSRSQTPSSHRAGIRVVATASAADLTYVRSLGADEAVDYKSEDLEKKLGQADVVIDLVGGATRSGKAKRHGVEAFFFLVEVTDDRLAKIADFIDNEKMSTQVGTVLPMTDARTAHEMLEGNVPRPRGKIVLDVRK
jgi:NADPH:quinone reductase-like Zn-dependent oxidoreductase